LRDITVIAGGLWADAEAGMRSATTSARVKAVFTRLNLVARQIQRVIGAWERWLLEAAQERVDANFSGVVDSRA
jgi:hypothetical protein